MQPEPNANQGNKAMNEYINDISQQTAERAFNGTSFSPDRRGESLRREYANDLASFQSVLEKYMKGEDEDKIDDEFERRALFRHQAEFGWRYSSGRRPVGER